MEAFNRTGFLSDPSFPELQKLKSHESVSPGGTVTLSCRFGCGALTDDNNPTWLQQKEENVPRMMLYSTGSRGSGVPARFSGSRTGNTMSLTITGALEEDEADYYCAVWSGSEQPSGAFGRGSETKTVQVARSLSTTVDGALSPRNTEFTLVEKIFRI